jgi:hypothetical protein
MARPTRGRSVALAAWSGGLAWLLAPPPALACPVCYGGDEGPLGAYFLTGALLSLLPLGMVAVIGVWYRRSTRSRRPARED